jgi:hypothetical protein
MAQTPDVPEPAGRDARGADRKPPVNISDYWQRRVK